MRPYIHTVLLEGYTPSFQAWSGLSAKLERTQRVHPLLDFCGIFAGIFMAQDLFLLPGGRRSPRGAQW